MPKVTFLPMNKTVDAANGESLLDVALNHSIPLMHACGGFCACTTCHVIVRDNDESLSEMGDEEEERLDRAQSVTLHSRLGCQAKVKGDVTVEILNEGEAH